MGWYQGRVYAPSATLDGDQDLTVIFCRLSHAKTEEWTGRLSHHWSREPALKPRHSERQHKHRRQ
jgi:hypothetical protein